MYSYIIYKNKHFRESSAIMAELIWFLTIVCILKYITRLLLCYKVLLQWLQLNSLFLVYILRNILRLIKLEKPYTGFIDRVSQLCVLK